MEARNPCESCWDRTLKWPIKAQSRWLAIASGRIDLLQKPLASVPIILVLCRGRFPEHVTQFWSNVDPKQITEDIISTLEAQRYFNPSLIQGVWTHGVTIAGFGILRLGMLSQRWNVPVVSITDEIPKNELIQETLLKNLSDG
ncbi:MAG TPA: DUF99 family protein, partial [Candidatus Hodarchaeales archaeon]|nr:DUF99 family protein [Candidatus Hodarchaeales archaeon]